MQVKILARWESTNAQFEYIYNILAEMGKQLYLLQTNLNKEDNE